MQRNCNRDELKSLLYPLRLTTFASSPKGTPLRYAGNFPATAKSRPLGEGGLTRSGKTEGVHRSKTKTAALRTTAERREMECYFRLLLGCPVEVLAGQRTAHGGGVGIVEHLQVTGDIGLQFLAGQADDVAVGQCLFGDGGFCHHALLLA